MKKLIYRFSKGRYQNRFFGISSLFLLFLFISIVVGSCSEEFNSPMTKNDAIPGQVVDIKVTPIAGGAILTYKLPIDENLSYVEAEIYKPNGKKVNFISSSFRDTISIVGLGSTNEQEVLIYSVSRGGVRSQPTSIKISPLTPPHISVLNSVRLSEGLGGVLVNFENESSSDLAIYVGRKINGTFKEEDVQYTKVKDGRLLFWGYPSESQEFGVFVRDRWDHVSDTVYATLTPQLEVMIDKSKFKVLTLANDGKYGSGSFERPENLWDGLWSKDYTNPFTGNNVGYKHALILRQDDGKPAAITIDLGQNVSISRIQFNHYWKYNTGEGGQSRGAKKWEVYVLPNYEDNFIPFTMGEWFHWTLLTTMENIRPTNQGGTAEDDRLRWEAGDTNIFTPPTETVRYIRIKAIESWSGLPEFDMSEMTIYGSVVK